VDEHLAFARHLRANATPQERKLWNAFASYRPRFMRQLPVGPYVADFACRRARIIIEVDGSQHATSVNDSRRTAALEAVGWQVLRFWNSEVDGNLEGIVEAVAQVVGDRLPPGEAFEPILSRAGRERVPRKSKERPPPAPPASAGGEQ
jgi:very-short-patch-repair endonuclease